MPVRRRSDLEIDAEDDVDTDLGSVGLEVGRLVQFSRAAASDLGFWAKGGKGTLEDKEHFDRGLSDWVK
jgi:hypothetical protein